MTVFSSPPVVRDSGSVTSGALRASVLVLACGSALACSVILKPRDDVERCGTADDCSPTGDERYVPICKFDDENTDLDSTKIDKICVADYRVVSCDYDSHGGQAMSNGFQDKFDDDVCTDLGCSEESRGKIGCPPPSGGGCDSGLELDDEFDVCVDPDADEPVIPGSFLSTKDELEGQHIKDQFCKSFFCDDTFVCNAQEKCQRCDPDADYGEGGCGLVYSEGALAKIYVLGDDLDDDCAGSDVEFSEPAVFGECS